MQGNLDVIWTTSRCEIQDMGLARNSLNPGTPESGAIFSGHVRSVEAVILFAFQATARTALTVADPAEASALWKQYLDVCDEALRELKRAKDSYPDCGTPELFNLALDYRNAAFDRYQQNLEDAEECARTPMPTGLFPKQN